MSEFFKTAMGYFNTNTVNQSNHYPSSSASAAVNHSVNSSTPAAMSTIPHSSGINQDLFVDPGEHCRSNTTWLSNEDFCGQLVNLAGLKLRVKDILAIGGFAYVFRVEDVNSHKNYALKRLISVENETAKTIEIEIGIHHQLKNHPHIVDLIAFVTHKINIGDEKRTEYLLLMELCTGGSLTEYLSEIPLEAPEILKVFYQAVCAVAHMHSQEPPISHRDIKIENFLIDERKQLKLCDFGSASRETFTPTLDWNAKQHNALEEKLCVVTTPMYRSPEMLDTWSNYEIGPKVDIWSLGCVLYVLCFQRHPFQDSGKLRIINGNYTMTADSPYHIFHHVIKGCLTVNPAERFDISSLLEHLAVISETMKWPLRGDILLKRKSEITTSPEQKRKGSKDSNQLLQSSKSIENGSETSEMGRSVFYDKSSNSSTSNEATGGGSVVNGANLFSSLKDGAGNFLRNLKDTSSKMMQTVQQTIGRSDIDVSYITSRILVMPTPSEGLESAYKSNNIEDVRHYIETRFAPHKVSVYNFGQKNYPRLPPPIRTVDAANVWTTTQAYAPILSNLYSLAEDMYGFLTADPKSIVIIQSPDGGGNTSAFFVSALLMYADLTLQPEDAVQVFAVKRHPVNLRASEFRYLYYLGDLLRIPPLHPHFKNVQLLSLTCQPVPRMTRAKDGCRLYAEIFVNDYFVLSTLPDTYDKLPLYLAGPGTIKIPLDLNVCGDMLIVLYHARKAMVKPHGVKICQFQLHTGFVPEQETLITLSVSDLDDVPDVDCVPSNFKVSLSLAVKGVNTLPLRNPPWTTKRFINGAQNLFSSHLEYEEMGDSFVTKPIVKNNLQRPNNNDSLPLSSSSVSSASPTLGSSPRPHAIPRSRSRPLPPEPVASIQLPVNELLLNVGNREEEINIEENNANLIMPDITSIQPEVLMVPSDTPARVDLLNLHHCYDINEEPSSDANFDLLGAFEDSNTHINNLPGSNGPIPDILSSNTQFQPFQSTANLDDILGPLNLNSTEPSMEILNPNAIFMPPNSTISSNTTNKFRITNEVKTPSLSEQQQKSNDPFADLASFSSILNIGFNTNSNLDAHRSNVSIKPNLMPPPRNKTDTKLGVFGMETTIGATGKQNNGRFGGTQSSNSTSIFNDIPGTYTSGSMTNGAVPRPTADYNRSHFMNVNTTLPSNNNTNHTSDNSPAGNSFADVFADILGEQGFKFSQKTNQSPRSINDMRKVERMKDMDPNQALIMEWTNGKKNNIRALLCTLHVVLWPNAKWVKCEMSQIISPTDVKKYYRKACLAVHPDKHTGTPNEEVAKLIFMELNYAWNEFEKDSTQQNVFMQ